jgi:hypothetical protein
MLRVVYYVSLFARFGVAGLAFMQGINNPENNTHFPGSFQITFGY